MATDSSVTSEGHLARFSVGRWFAVLAGAGILVALMLSPRDTPRAASVSINQTDLELFIARTPAEHRRGLSGRDELPGDGMFFLFDAPSPRVFWMREMRFPIDIVWVRGDTVIGITTDLQPPAAGTPDIALERFGSPGPVDGVIELAAGRAASLGIAPGPHYKIDIRFPASRPSRWESIRQNIKSAAEIL